MNNFEEVRFQQFDQVQLRTTRNVKYLSAPPEAPVSPKGVWSVAAVINVENGHDLLVIKQGATIRIPAGDVLKVAAYDINAILAPLGRFTDGQGKRKETREAEGSGSVDENA